MSRYIVLDTNCLLQIISAGSPYHKVWLDFINRRYTLCLSNDILEEYEEVLASHSSSSFARIAIEVLLRARNVVRIDAHYHFNLITIDPDDNKFVDCAIAANADYIVSDDRHFRQLKEIPFPRVEVRRLEQFYEELCEEQ